MLVIGEFFYATLLPSLPPSFTESMVESWFIDDDKLSIFLSILISKYAATAMGKPTLAMAVNKSSMIISLLSFIGNNKYAVSDMYYHGVCIIFNMHVHNCGNEVVIIMDKCKRIKYSKLSDIELYELVLNGNIRTFPSGFWVYRGKEEARDAAKKLLRFLLIEKLKFTKEDIKNEVSKNFISKYKLHTASKLFGRSSIRYVIESMPELGIQPWQFRKDKVPYRYWTKEENRINALRYLFEVELNWSMDDVKEELTWDILKEHGLLSLHGYYPNLWEIFKAAYNIDVEPWEMLNSSVPSYTWKSRENRVKAIKWLIGKLNSELNGIDRKTFARYGLSSLLSDYYGDSAKRAIRDTFNCKIL